MAQARSFRRHVMVLVTLPCAGVWAAAPAGGRNAPPAATAVGPGGHAFAFRDAGDEAGQYPKE